MKEDKEEILSKRMGRSFRERILTAQKAETESTTREKLVISHGPVTELSFPNPSPLEESLPGAVDCTRREMQTGSQQACHL